ncbi:MAG: anthranilate phosphoribosyltransferase [Myxococcales bacterium]|nr:anthranilate phosphoribosyltransferase [Myxococcales bacterium]MCB9531580.1 anthranilate phosphoribosyltransferase [Myxococcales bacterium]MCB9532769.1 anthranilate phosphoribosyltransferase [Myxococcales bacterium]
MSETYRRAIRTLVSGASLDAPTATALMSAMLEGVLDSPQVAAVLTAIAVKGESADELAAFASVMRRHAVTIDAGAPVLDTCGTGGSGLPTINTSTLAAFVVASCGVKVAKHGNRASSGRCGSMDVLEQLGVDIELTPARAEALIRGGDVVFLYARRHHPALGQVTPIRRALGFRTCFNLIGPICNPAGAQRQVIGVSDPERAPLLLEALRRLGCERALVVWGEDGLDEISLCAPTRLWELCDGEVTERTVAPEAFGLQQVRFDAIAGGDTAENVAHFERILDGRDDGARTLHTALNAGAALYVAGRAPSIGAGLEIALDTLQSGRALRTFERYRAATRQPE